MKKGERAPWRMTYTWPSGAKGTRVFHTEDDARRAAQQQERVHGPSGERCTVAVTQRP